MFPPPRCYNSVSTMPGETLSKAREKLDRQHRWLDHNKTTCFDDHDEYDMKEKEEKEEKEKNDSDPGSSSILQLACELVQNSVETATFLHHQQKSQQAELFAQFAEHYIEEDTIDDTLEIPSISKKSLFTKFLNALNTSNNMFRRIRFTEGAAMTSEHVVLLLQALRHQHVATELIVSGLQLVEYQQVTTAICQWIQSHRHTLMTLDVSWNSFTTADMKQLLAEVSVCEKISVRFLTCYVAPCFLESFLYLFLFTYLFPLVLNNRY